MMKQLIRELAQVAVIRLARVSSWAHHQKLGW